LTSQGERIFRCRLIFFLISLLVLLPALAAEQKISFWDTPRKGANCFNAEPSEEWFAAAQQLGLEWVRLTFGKWQGKERDFLFGNLDDYQGLVVEDLHHLKKVLAWAEKYHIKLVITPLSLPGNRWIQKNNNKLDLRLWNDKHYWQQAASFWQDLARELNDNPAIYAYNLINEPIPEMQSGVAEHGDPKRFLSWYEQYRHSARDLPEFYRLLIKAIREVDQNTPIMLDAGWYAQPNAFIYWTKIPDDKLLYAFHLYEPYEFTNNKNFKETKGYQYPGNIPFAGEVLAWDKQQIKNYLAPFFNWAQQQKIPASRLVAGEFGCYRRNSGCREYLADAISVFNEHKIHWAFYSFREDEWDGYDYEVGTGALSWKYWQAVEAGKNPPVPRTSNTLFDVLKREFQR
jgi:hypothetical protein